MEDQDSRNVLGIGPLHEIYVLIQILFNPKADDVNAGGFELSKMGILIRNAELQRMNKVNPTDDALSMSDTETGQQRMKHQKAESYRKNRALSCEHEFLLNIDGQFTYCFRAYPSNRSEVPSFSQSSSLDAK